MTEWATVRRFLTSYVQGNKPCLRAMRATNNKGPNNRAGPCQALDKSFSWKPSNTEADFLKGPLANVGSQAPIKNLKTFPLITL